MGIEIVSIQDAVIKQAAMIADSKGKHANNGILDYNELSIFKKESKKLGCYNKEAKSIRAAVKDEHEEIKRQDKAATMKAYGVGTLASLGVTGASLGLIKSLPAASLSLSTQQIGTVNTAADNVLNNLTNLGQKGVSIHNLEDTGKKIFKNKYADTLIEQLIPGIAISRGHNAAYDGKSAVLINREKLSLSSFHELGHAFNHKNSALFSALQKVRTPAIAIAGLLSAIPAFTKEIKPEDGKELTTWQKFKNGFRKACPALATIAMTPVVAEEAMATIRGNAWAKKLLDPSLYKKVVKTNALGLATYVLTAVGMGLFGYAALKAKDKYVAKNEQKRLEQAQLDKVA